MSIKLGDEAPDFTAQTTQGEIKFHDYLGDSWGVLFSHPKDFTPVCTTELGYMAGLKPEFDKRNVKIIGLSVDPVENHQKWSQDIADATGNAPNYPMIGDTDLSISKLYGMLPAATEGGSECGVIRHRAVGADPGGCMRIRTELNLDGLVPVHTAPRGGPAVEEALLP